MPPVLAGLAAAYPVIDSAIDAVHAGWMPVGDDGIIATRGWDVLTSHSPLVGQYSEAGLVIRGQVMHSPGPMLYWLLALPAHYGSVAGLAVTMAVVNTAAIVGCVAIARRRGGLPLMVAAAAGIALMCQSLAAESLHDIWNPAAALFPFLLLVFTGWSLACGAHRLLPLAALLASFVVQTHLMYAAPTAVVLAVGFGGLALTAASRRRARRAGATRSQAPRIWPWALSALLVGALCWAEPAVQEIDGNPGNLTTIVRTVEHRGTTLGRSAGINAVIRSIGAPPWFLHVPGSEWQRKRDVLVTPGAGQAVSAALILGALALAVIGGLALRRRDLAAAALIGLGMSAAIGLQAANNPARTLLAETLGYTLWWGSLLGLWVWLTLFWAAWLVLRAAAGRAAAAARARQAARAHEAGPGAGARIAGHQAAIRTGAIGILTLAAIGGVAAIGRAVAADGRPDSHVYEYRPLATLAAGLTGALPAHVTVAYHLGPLDTGTQPIEPALRFLLVRHGDRPLADGSYPRLGSYYVQGRRPVRWIVYLADGTRRPAGMRLLARTRFRSPWGPEVLGVWLRPVHVPGRSTGR